MDANAIKAQFPGYASWNNPDAIVADFKATGGAGKGGGGSAGPGGINYQPVTAQSLTDTEDKVFQVLKPYYQKLAQQSQGDFNTAVKLLNSDYQQGVRNAKTNYATAQGYNMADLQGTLKQLGVSNLVEQQGAVDKLNQRGAAVYQNNPDGSYNALQPSDINSSYDPNNPTLSGSNTSIANPANANMGQGGFELARLQNQQRLQQEAQTRAKIQPIEQAGIQLKQYTNPNEGFDINKPETYANLTADQMSQLGTSEQSLIKSRTAAAQQARDTQQSLQDKLQNDVYSKASGLASAGISEVGNTLGNLQNKIDQSNFVTTGVT